MSRKRKYADNVDPLFPDTDPSPSSVGSADNVSSAAVGTVAGRDDVPTGKRGRTGHFLDEEGRAAAKAVFLAAYDAPGAMTAAAKAAGVARQTVYEWIERDLEFAAGVAECDRAIDDSLEREVYRRSVEGIDRPLSYQGELTGHVIREYSDNLLMFGTKKRISEYRDNVTLVHDGHLAPEVKDLLKTLAAAAGGGQEHITGQETPLLPAPAESGDGRDNGGNST